MPLAGSRLCVAFSAGADSTALLVALATLRARAGFQLRALHVDHGLQPAARQWARGAQRCARALRVPCRILRVKVALAAGVSPEAAAREARYSALNAALQPGEWLLTAHHAEDQAETLLLQLLRGAGLAGLAAMPVLGQVPAPGSAHGLLLRPLLEFPRAELRRYVERHGCAWSEDPSNDDARLDRNYLRQRLWPLIVQRWPAAARTLGRSAAHLSAARVQLDAQVARQLALARAGSALQVPVLRRLPLAARIEVVRAWLEEHGQPSADQRRLHEICTALLTARRDAQPQVAWGGSVVRRHAQCLHVTAADVPAASWKVLWHWRREPRLALPDGSLLWLEPHALGAVRLWQLGATLSVRCGARLPQPRVNQRLQEAGVPPWQRDRVPLIHDDGRLIAVGDHWIAPELRARQGAVDDQGPRAHLRWLRAL
ncbi:MAG: tRNA lysidine(34) synthetase TilS [Steroidobacteraceae bacterium]